MLPRAGGFQHEQPLGIYMHLSLSLGQEPAGVFAQAEVGVHLQITG